MKILFLLIVLTQNSAGDINASFVNTETLEQCQQKSAMLENIFASAGIPIVESRCLQSELRFSEFNHASASSLIRHFYLVNFSGADSSGEAVQVEKMPDWKSCMLQAKQTTASGRVYCASSVQSIVD